MTNNAWGKLCVEWNANQYNDEFIALCNRTDLDPYDVSASRIEDMKWIRKECKKNYIWLEDKCESDIYLAVMPFGGHTQDSIKVLKSEIKKYRDSGKRNGVYRAIISEWD